MTLDFIHVFEFEPDGESQVKLSRQFAPGMKIIANGSVHDPERALEVQADRADIIALGRGER